MATTIDDVFKKIGEFRQYQWFIMSIVSYTVLTLAAFPAMIAAFITAEPDWECVDGYMNNTVCKFNESITLTSDDYKARCKMPREAWMFVDDFTSVVTEYELVCDDSILLSVTQSCYFVGMLIALLVGGPLSDHFGRRFVWYAGLYVATVATWVMIYPKVIVVFIVCRIFIGIGSGLRNCTSFVMLLEFTTEKYRVWIASGSNILWAVGVAIMPVIGYLVPAWRTFILVTAIFAAPVFILCWFVPESPRLLLSKGREEEATTVLEKMSKMNKRPLPDDLALQRPVILEKRISFLQLFRSCKIAKLTLVSWDLWFANALVYYGVSYGSVDLGGNRYLNVFLVSVVEIPAYVVFFWFANIFGRKKSVILPMIAAFIASVISVSIPTNESSASVGGRVAAAIIAKFCITFSFAGIYVWCVELFPTTVRSTALATSSAAARVGSFGASYIIWLIRYHAALPYGIMGAICLQAAILGLLLPETKGEPTLETIDDMSNKDQGVALVVNARSSEPETDKKDSRV